MIGAAALHNVNWFYPAFLMIVGAHYLPFIFLYGMWQYGVPAAVMLGAGLGLGRLAPASFPPGGRAGGDRPAALRRMGLPGPPAAPGRLIRRVAPGGRAAHSLPQLELASAGRVASSGRGVASLVPEASSPRASRPAARNIPLGWSPRVGDNSSVFQARMGAAGSAPRAPR